MNIEEQQVRKFYDIIWNKHDKSAISDVIHQSFVFHGSLSIEKQGHNGFAEYLDMIHDALDNYTCTIKDLVVEQSKIFTKMRFSGIHQDTLLGYKATGRLVTWDGAALFHFTNNKISSLWVLGDLNSLVKQLSE